MCAFDRRSFLKSASLVGAGAFVAGCSDMKNAAAVAEPKKQLGKNVANLHADPIENVRVGIIGLGMRGYGAAYRLSKIDGCTVKALCDVRPKMVSRVQKMLGEKRVQKSAEYSNSPDAWKKMCQRDDLDLIYICTPWRLHVPNAVYAMNHGKHAAVEVPAAMTIKECWELVDTSEQTQRHCMMLENCCYDQFEMMTLNMVRAGVLGDLVHGEAAYIHDLRSLNFNKNAYYKMWRLVENAKRNGNLYPTHGLGPIAQCMNINRGDKFTYLTSMSTSDFNMHKLAKSKAKSDPFFEHYIEANFRGNMNSTTIRTAKGRTILVQHDVTSPRPYTRLHELSGTKGFAQKWPFSLISLEGYKFADGSQANPHKYLNSAQMSEIRQKFEHPLYKNMGAWAKNLGGHGGMDSLMDWRLIYCLRKGLPLDQNVYDAASWSAVAPLSEWSVANRSNSIDVPDFTRGAWKNTKPLQMKL